MGSSGHLGHLDVMPCPFLWQCQLRGRYHEIPKISPGAYIFQRPFLRAIFQVQAPGGLIFGGAIERRVFYVTSLGVLYLEGLMHRGAYVQNFMVNR